jgi:hypothetical protein
MDFDKWRWQVVALIFGTIVILIFKKRVEPHIGKLIDAFADRVRKNPPLTPGPKWNKSGDLFWLGHDLMWTAYHGYVGSKIEVILHGLTVARQHLHYLDLTSTRLDKLVGKVQSPDAASWTREEKSQIAVEVEKIIREIGRSAEKNQPDFGEVRQKSTTAGM